MHGGLPLSQNPAIGKILARIEATMEEEYRIRSSFIPLEVCYEILKRLPTKSLSRFRCVSKTWNSLIRSPKFIADQYAATAAAAAGNSHLFVRIRHINRALGGFDEHLLIDLKALECGLNFLQPSKSTIPSSVTILSHTDGVLLGSLQFGSEFRHVLCNPMIRRYVVLPEPLSTSCYYQLGLGFVPSKNDMGVVKIIRDFDVKNGPLVLPRIVKVCYARERVWKTIAAGLASTYFLFERPNMHCCTNGRVHWVVQARYENSRFVSCHSEHLLVFDFERERFETLDLPGELVNDLKLRPFAITLLLFKQNLSALFHGSQKYSLWSLAAYSDVSSWAKVWSFDIEREVLFSVFVGWRADYNLIVSLDKEGIMRVHDPDVGSSKESFEFPFRGRSTNYVWGFNESLFLSDDEMQALPLTQIQPALPN